MTFTLPEAPSSNRYWRHVGPKVLLSSQARAYRKHVATCVLTALADRRITLVAAKAVGPIAVTVHWYRGRRAGDLDNRLKITLDALRGLLFEDDAQIAELHAVRHESRQNPRMEITVTPATP